jgi:hypothetical protein
MRSLFSRAVAAISIFSLIFSPFAVAQEGTLRDSYTPLDRAINKATLCLMMGQPKNQCVPEKLNDDGVKAVNEEVDKILKAVTTLQNSDLPISKQIDEVVGAANKVGDLIKKCAGSPDNPENCAEKAAKDASEKLRKATDAARKACDELPGDPGNKVDCNAAVDSFENTANESFAKILAIAGPVLAACAVSAGTGCAIAAILAIVQLFGDSGSGGSSGGEEGTVKGNGEGGTAEENNERLREQFPETGELKVNSEGGAIRISGTVNGRNVNFRLGGYFEKPNYKAGDSTDVTAEKIAEAINSAGSLANYLSGTKQKVQHTVLASKDEGAQPEDGVAFCQSLKEGIVTSESANSEFAIVIVIPGRGPAARVHTRAADSAVCR